MKRILSIAGSDSGGGAGIQIDIKTSLSIGCDASTVITAVTAQNYSEVRMVEQLSLSVIESQFRAVMDEIEIDAIKIGMLGNADTAKLIAQLLDEYKPRFVVADPVLIATSGGILGTKGTTEAIIEYIVPRCTLLTPNIDEAEALCSLQKGEIDSKEKCDVVWQEFKAMGLKSLLLKGGHAAEWQENGVICDTLYTQNEVVEFNDPRIDTKECLPHGSSVTLSTAINWFLVLGYMS